MSKGDGLKIGIKFTESLVGNIAPQVTTIEKQDGVWSANGSYSSSNVDNAKDNNTSTYWESRSTANYIQIVRPNTRLLGIKAYKGSSYRPTNFTLRTSEDGSTYADITTNSFIAATGWEEIMFNEPIESDYFRINFGYSSRLYLYELVLIVEEYDNFAVNEFIVTGKEYKYVQGLDGNSTLIDKRYRVVDYGYHPTEEKSILLTFDWWEKFNNVVGDLKVMYDASKGTLAGDGGAVESFEVSFTPQDLVSTPDPGVTEIISVAPVEVMASFNPVEYPIRFSDMGTITVAPVEVTATLINVSEINP